MVPQVPCMSHHSAGALPCHGNAADPPFRVQIPCPCGWLTCLLDSPLPPHRPPSLGLPPPPPQGTSRGGANIKEIVRRIDLWGLDMVFVVGGNGGNAAANAIQEEVEACGVKCVVAGVPKSIDNDILLVGGGGGGGGVCPALGVRVCWCGVWVCVVGGGGRGGGVGS